MPEYCLTSPDRPLTSAYEHGPHLRAGVDFLPYTATMAEGVDYSAGAISAADLQAAGKSFAVCYVVPGRSVSMGGAEYADHRDHGILQCGVWERSATASLGGAAAGRANMTEALDYASSLGVDTNGAPLFCVLNDWDAAPGDMPAILDYAKGLGSVRGRDLAGGYGSYWPVKYVVENGDPVLFLWQTYAWSGGLWHPRAQLQQYRNSATTIGGVDVDFDRAVFAVFGQWGSSPPPPTGNPGNRPTLAIGATGPAVVELQNLLNSAGAAPPLATDGSFGPLTETAVRAYQTVHSLTVDGVVAATTWAALLSVTPPPPPPPPPLPPPVHGTGSFRSAHPTLWQGSTSGTSVVHMQQLLGNLVPDGVFGPFTRNRVIAFQAFRGLAADGVCGPQTWARLHPTVSQGSTGDRVREVQAELGVGVDGADGPATTGRVVAFQQSVGLTPDGVCGLQTYLAFFGSLG